MRIILEKEEALAIIHSALCNGGLSDLQYSGVALSVNDEDYAQAKKELKDSKAENEVICIEDVWTQILRSGKPLQFRDEEGDEELEFNLDKALEELSKTEAFEIVSIYNEENDDAETGSQLLQMCLYGEVIFG